MEISIYGHAYSRVFSYTEGGKYHEFSAPGGAFLLSRLLGFSGTQDSAAVRKEYAELKQFSGKDKSGYWAVSRRMGYTDGTETALFKTDSPYNLIWDEGLGNLALPEETRNTLWASNKSLPDKHQFAAAAPGCFLFLDADVLRGAGAMISREISWERTASELIWQIQNNPAIAYLSAAPRILITFAEDGAVYIRREDGKLKASLYLTNGCSEGTHRGKLEGEVDDTFLLMTVNLAMQFQDIIQGTQPIHVMQLLKTACELTATGFSPEMLQSCKYPMITISEAKESSFDIPDDEDWCVIGNAGGKRIFDLAFEYVLEGESALRGFPMLRFGALTTVDRFEIEAYQNIRNLIIGYANDTSVKPLSIAVFGSPGSGKSFGVTQIAENLLPGKVKKLEFNVSQFTGLSDLGAAFQKVRDAILEGKLPLVFFDEFDSDHDGTPLGWIKSFLMPMQDGKFKDESGEHPLGKCILVFAGGTSADFTEFSAPMQSGKPEIQQAFRNIKGPDFISRLKGTVNVLGPNPKDDRDTNYILRRALLLRSLCERKLSIKNGAAPVSPNIIWAMLLVPEYKHGARSMEAILDMSRLESNVWEPVSLPFYTQLALHVDADAFIKLVLREAILNSFIEKLAQAIHEDFQKKEASRGHSEASYNIPWEQLPEDIKGANRAQAQDIAVKLRQIGYDYDAGDTPFTSTESFSENEILFLAQNEHIRWMNNRITAGWVYGAKRDNNKKKHPLLVPWEKLPFDEKQKDIDVVENIIPLLKSIGLRVYKTI